MAPVKSTNIIDIKDIKKVLYILLDNWLLLLLFAVASAGAAYIYSYKLPTIHAASMQLLLKSEDIFPVGKGFENYGVWYSYEKKSNEKRIVISTDLIALTIEKLNLEVSYYIVGRIQTKEVYSGIPFSVEARVYSHSFYEHPFTFKILDLNNYELNFENNGNKTSIRHAFDEPFINNDFYLLIKKSNSVTPATLATLKEITYQFLVHNKRNLVYKFKNAIEAKDVEWSHIMEVVMEDENPERAVQFLDTLARVYMDNSLKSKIKVNENTIKYIDRHLTEVIAILDSIENSLEAFKEQKDILNLTKEEETYYSNLTNYEVGKRKYELQLQSLAYLKEYVISNKNKELLPPSMYIDDNDAYLKKAINELYNLQVTINNSLFSSTGENTSIKQVEYNIELLRNDILKYIINSEKAIHEKIQSYEGEIAFYEGLLKGVPRNQRQMLNISRKLQVNEKLYLYLLEKRAETVIARAGIIPEITLVESPHDIGIVKPDKNKIYSTFISAGFLFAFAISIIRFLFFTKIENAEQLRELTQLPVSGEVYFAREAKESYMVANTLPRSLLAESFRAIRTNLEYFSPGVNSKTILITSNRPGVGKTFCSLNLAIMLARGNKKTLLVEMDLHKPKIHQAMNLSNHSGVSTVLIGKCLPAEVIVRSEVENLDVLVSGPLPPNPSELLLNENLLSLMEYAKSNYDYVVIDTPPLGIISDTLLLMKHSHINLFILNTRHNPKEGLNFAHNFAQQHPILPSASENGTGRSFAFILNNVLPKKSKYYYKRYKYDYGSGTEKEKAVVAA